MGCSDSNINTILLWYATGFGKTFHRKRPVGGDPCPLWSYANRDLVATRNCAGFDRVNTRRMKERLGDFGIGLLDWCVLVEGRNCDKLGNHSFPVEGDLGRT